MESSELKHIIEKKISHSYIEKYIQKPFIDNDKVLILNYLYNDLQMSLQKKQQYIATVILVQIALDTHELVPVNELDEMSQTEKQLFVLAGDYYSGLYYLFLSELEDVEMVRVLATAIKNINEHKMKLFYENIQSLEDLLHTIEYVETILFVQVAKFLEADQTIILIIQELLMINRLYQEKSKMFKQQFSYIQKFMENNNPEISNSAIHHFIDNEIENRKQKLDGLLLHLPYRFDALENIIRDRITMTYNTSVAEEG